MRHNPVQVIGLIVLDDRKFEKIERFKISSGCTILRSMERQEMFQHPEKICICYFNESYPQFYPRFIHKWVIMCGKLVENPT